MWGNIQSAVAFQPYRSEFLSFFLSVAVFDLLFTIMREATCYRRDAMNGRFYIHFVFYTDKLLGISGHT